MSRADPFSRFWEASAPKLRAMGPQAIPLDARAENLLTQNHILIVEDDPDISAPLAGFLREHGFMVSMAESAEAAGDILGKGAVDLLLLDIMLPGEDGLALCRRLRSAGGPRIIMVTALSEPDDKVAGLEMGADDYVSKPFDLRELLARIRAVLRREPLGDGTSQSSFSELVLRFSGFAFYPHRRFLRSPNGLRIPLTGAETDLLLVLCQNAGRILSREELIKMTRGEGFAISMRAIDLLISRLRRKLAGDDPLVDPIRTVRADGYAFQPDVTTD